MKAKTLALAVALAPALVGAGCKRQRAPLVEEVWDVEPTLELTEALGSLAPPWPAPTRAVLDSGLATFWLHEPDAPVFHARLLIPTVERDGESPTLAATTIVAEHVREVLTRRLAALGVAVELGHGPDRFEVAVHGHDDDADTILAGLAAALDPNPPTAGLERARAQLADRIRAVAPDEAATAELVAGLLGRPLDTQRLDPKALRGMPAEVLEDAWRTLSDPRRAVLIVHAGTSAEDNKDTLHELSNRWHGVGRRDLAESAVARLRADPAPVGGEGRLLSAPAAPIDVARSPHEGSPVLILGRVIPTESVEERSLARLAQRIVAQELDARLVIAGDRAVFVARVSLSSRDPDGSATKAVDVLSTLARTRQPQQRLYTAAELWLGARVVQSSLDGEDWTALWSEAMDLAESDEGIATALARDAATMLEPDAESLKTWQERWLDPRAGEAGWTWTVAGADAKITRRLSRIAPIRE